MFELRHASVHAINIHEEDDEIAKQAAIDRYGRDRIKHEDIVVWLLELGGEAHPMLKVISL